MNMCGMCVYGRGQSLQRAQAQAQAQTRRPHCSLTAHSQLRTIYTHTLYRLQTTDYRPTPCACTAQLHIRQYVKIYIIYYLGFAFYSEFYDYLRFLYNFHLYFSFLVPNNDPHSHLLPTYYYYYDVVCTFWEIDVCMYVCI